MDDEREWRALLKDMCEDPRTRILGVIFILGGVLVKIGVIGYMVNPHNKAFYYVMLSGLAAYTLFLCCGWIVRPSMNCFRNLPSFLCFCLTLMFYLGIATLIVFPLASEYKRDSKVSFNVSDATLAQFSLSSSTTLDYNLTVKVVVGPNRKKQGVYYGALQAWASYQGYNFTSLSLPPFYLGGKSNHTYNASTVVLQSLVFQGRQDHLVLPPNGLKRYQQDKVAGCFSIDVTLSYEGFRGHHQLKGVDTFTFEDLPLPNATSGWLDNAGFADARGTVVVCIVVLVICITLLLCCLCWGCATEAKYTGPATCCCMLLLLIQIPIFTPPLVRALKTSDQVKLSISNATLTQFNFPSTTINNTLAYNLSLAITIGPNTKKTGVYFDKMEAVTYYQGQNITSLPLSPLFLQGRQQYGSRTVILHPVLQGQQVLVLTSHGFTHYRKETTLRRYNIVVTLSYSGIRTDDVYNSGGANGTSTMASHGKQLRGVASFELRVPLLANYSGRDVATAAANINLDFKLGTILGFVAYGSLFL